MESGRLKDKDLDTAAAEGRALVAFENQLHVARPAELSTGHQTTEQLA